MKRLIALIIAMSVAVPAMADTVTGADMTYDFSKSFSSGASASGIATLSNFAFGNSSVTFDMIVTNTSSSIGGDIRLTSIGWDISPAVVSVVDTTPVFSSASNVALGPTQLSVCLYSGSNCNGGANGGLEDPSNKGLHGDPTTTGVFHVTVNFSHPVTTMSIDTVDAKFQTSGGSYEVAGVLDDEQCLPVVQKTSEPAGLAIMGIALMCIGCIRKS